MIDDMLLGKKFALSKNSMNMNVRIYEAIPLQLSRHGRVHREKLCMLRRYVVHYMRTSVGSF